MSTERGSGTVLVETPIEVGNIVEGIVTGITKFGAFVQLSNGKTGLVHISEVADTYVQEIGDYLKQKDKVKVKVLTVDDKGKISLSIKQTLPKAPAPVRPAYENKSRGWSAGPPRGGVGRLSFEDKLARFMRESDERIQDLLKHNEAKRGGRGPKRGEGAS